MKSRYLFLVTLLVLGTFAVLTDRSSNSAAEEIVDNFLYAARQGHVEQAYFYLSRAFKRQSSSGELARFIDASMLSEFLAANRLADSLEKNQATITVGLDAADGRSVSLEFQLLFEDSAWRISAIRQKMETRSSARIPAPVEEQQQELAKGAMAVFAQAVKDNKMADFHQYISPVWRQQVGEPELEQAYSSLIASGVDLTGLAKMTPELDRGSGIKDEGILVINGLYPTRPSEVHFEQKFIHRNQSEGWKLIGFHIQFKPIDGEPSAANSRQD